MILREVRCLRKYFEVHVASVRPPDRPPEQLTPEEREEAAQTYYVKPEGRQGALLAHLGTLAHQPAAYLNGLLYALRLSGGHPIRVIFYLGYYSQALLLGRWMARNRLRHLHVHYSSTVGLLIRRAFPITLSISFHGPDEFNDPAGFFLREKVGACTFVRAISHYARSQLMKSSDFADWSKIEVLHMGVDPGQFAPRPFRANPSPFELICVGRLAPVKAQHILIAAIQELVRAGTDVRLHLVGGGPDRASLEADVSARGMEEHVVFHGFTPQDQLEKLYSDTDVFVLASFAEGVPGVLMEAMAMQIPCVSTWITGIPELIRNGTDGLLVAPSDAAALAAAIRRLAEDPELRQRIGESARRRILDGFDLERNSEQLADILRPHLSG